MLFVWPRSGGDWGDDLDGARASIAQAAAAVARDQTVILVASDDESIASIQAHPILAQSHTNLQIQQVTNNDIWIRDFGPLTIFADGQRQFVDYRFNGWAGKYAAQWDDQVSETLITRNALGTGAYQRRNQILEGGALDCNGAGSLLVTRCCLLDSPRNPTDSEPIWNTRFAEDLGITTVHWLDYGHLEGDDTDGHVDTLVRFVARDSIVYQGCNDPTDAHYDQIRKLGDQLASLKQPNGEPYKLQALPWPQAQYDEDGRRLPAGYANFLIANRVVLVPQYHDAADAEALALISACFPKREAVGIDCRPLIRQNGAIHCAAMQIPKNA